MEYIKLGLITEHTKFAEALSRRITEISAGIEVNIVSKGTESDFDFVMDEKFVLDRMPVSGLIGEIAVDIRLASGKNFFLKEDDKTKIWCLRSSLGGSGCTAAATVLSRVLAGRCDGEVLLIHVGNIPAKTIYSEEIVFPLRPAKELEYMLGTGQEMSLDRYMAKDRYGVFTVETGEYINELLAAAEKEGRFSHIVVDGGNTIQNVICNININIISCDDIRTKGYEETIEEEIEEGSREFYIFNKSRFTNSRNPVFYIPYEEEGFVRNGEKISIRMDGAFAAIIGQLAEAAEETE